MATIVESSAARNVPNQILPMTKSSFPVLGSSANGTFCSSRLSPALVPPWFDTLSGTVSVLLSPSKGVVSDGDPRG